MKIVLQWFCLWIWCTGIILCSPARADEWKPFVFPWNQSPVDLSSLLETPAGDHGFLDIKDGKFVFEDKTPARFWGTALSGSACFPDVNQAPLIAERLSCLGINLVRFEYMDAPWSKPSLLELSRQNKLELNTEALKRLDYFIFQLENRGIYIYINGLDARVIQEGENIPSGDKLLPGLKGVIHFAPALRQLYQDFIDQFWTHRNEYDQHEYRDNPALVLFDLFSENRLRELKTIPPFYAGELLKRWQDWCKRQNIKPVPAFPSAKKSALQDAFLNELTSKSCREMIAFTRSLGVKCPIGASGTIVDIQENSIQSANDFVSIHRFDSLPEQKMIPVIDSRMVDSDYKQQSTVFSETAISRLMDKPFLWAKWGKAWPDPYRAELPLWVAAMACFQEWDGCVSAGYASIADLSVDYINSPLDSFNDPCVMGLFPAAGLLFHQQDVPPAKKLVRITSPDLATPQKTAITPQTAMASRLVDFGKVEIIPKPKVAGSLVFAPTMPEDIEGVRVKFDKSPVFYRDEKRGLVVINTPKTQALTGRLLNAKKEDMKDVELQSGEDFGVACVSSLDREPISKSGDILITVVSQAQNSGFTTRKRVDTTFVNQPGQGPILLKNTPVKIRVRNKQRNWKLYAVNGDGQNLDSIPFQIEDGLISFAVGTQGTLYYRLQNEKKKK